MSKDSPAYRYARLLLDELGGKGAGLEGPADHPALAWRRAGLMHVTGLADGPGLVCPAVLAAAADGALLALKALVPNPGDLPLNGALLLGERARLLGLARGGRISANGSCRLLDALDGRIALNLARPDDWDLMPILLEADQADDWETVERLAARQSAATLVELGTELGLPIALDRPLPAPDRLFPADVMARPAPPRPAAPRPAQSRRAAPLVVDLAPLWAGPLAASLLAKAGADVVKVESVTRLDGARRGNAAFYDLLNEDKRSVALDFGDPDGLAALRSLIARADIVIEGSRPRALERLGIDREGFVASGGAWVAITAHDDPGRVGFGDDAAVAAGLSSLMAEGWGKPMFAGDAIADPLTGLHAALGAWAAWVAGGGRLIRLSLSGTVAYALGAGVAGRDQLPEWQALAEADQAPLYPLRAPARAARAAGADNDMVRARC